MDIKTIQTAARELNAVVVPPGSKSITNRAYILAALANGETRLSGVLYSDDTRYMSEALKQLGVEIEQDEKNCRARIVGCAGRFPADHADLFLGNSGTSIRFLAAALACGSGTFRLDGVERMRKRPIGDLVDALRLWGVNIEYEQEEGFPPIIVRSNGRFGGQTEIRGSVSSQYLSALMMAAVGATEPVTINVLGELVSRPYVEMTRAMIEAMCRVRNSEQCAVSSVQLNANADEKENPSNGSSSSLLTAHCSLHTSSLPAPCSLLTYSIEPDASAASYFFAAAAIVGGQVSVRGLSCNALQGDIRFVDLLEQMGCEVEWLPNETVVRRCGPLRGIDCDMHDISDTAQTLGVVALFANSPTTIRNVANMRVKETDRIAALCAELRKFGAAVDEYPDGLTITPLPVDQYASPTIATYEDHRMAMSFAVAGLKIPGVRIENPGCVSKTFPRFFDELEKLLDGET